MTGRHRHTQLLPVLCGMLFWAAWGMSPAAAQTASPVRIFNAASGTFVFKTGESDTTRSNRTETVVLLPAPLASSLLLSAAPKAVIGNGVDTSKITATVLDSTGAPVPDGAVVTFVTSRGQFANLDDTISVLTANGIASTRLRSAVLTGDTASALVQASTAGVSGTDLVRQVSVIFYPAAISGRVVSAQTGVPVPGAVAVVLNQTGTEVGRDTTGAAGRYLITLTLTGGYTLVVACVNEFGDLVHGTSSFQVTVPASGGLPSITPSNTIAGSIVDAVTGLPVRQGGIRVAISRLRGSGLPGGLTMPAVGLTDSRGVFVFDSLSPGEYDIRTLNPLYPGVVVVNDTMSGSFAVSSNIGTTASSPLEVSKTSNRRIAEIGDALTYTVTIHNSAQSRPLRSMTVVDDLPVAFVYAPGSSRIDGLPVNDPGIDRSRLTWSIPDSLGTGGTRTLTYRVSLGAGALESKGVNRVIASAITIDGDSLRSGEASVQVTVRAGVFTDLGIVIGKVFFDDNGNGYQDRGETGIRGVELWMEDGTRIVTGDDGKYSLPEVKPGQHVIRVNELTLPNGAKLRATSSEFARDGSTRFIRLVESGIVRADFFVTRPGQARLRTGFFRTGLPAAARLHAVYIIRWGDIGAATRITLTDTLPQGFSYVTENISPAQFGRSNSTPSARILSLTLPSRPANTIDTLVVPFNAGTTAPGVRIRSQARLVFCYARGRDAEIHGKMVRYNPPSAPVISGAAPPADGSLTTPLVLPAAARTPHAADAGVSPAFPATALTAIAPVPASGALVGNDRTEWGPGQLEHVRAPAGLQDANRAWWRNYLINLVEDRGFEIQVSSWQTKWKGGFEARRLMQWSHDAMVVEGWHYALGLRQRVKVRYFPTHDEAKINAYRVSVAELDTLPFGSPYTIVIHHQDGWGYTIQVLKCEAQWEAESEAGRFRRAGYTVRTEQYPDRDRRMWHRVLVGQYETELQAVEAAESLKLPRDEGGIARSGR